MAKARDPNGNDVPEVKVVSGKGGTLELFRETLYGYVPYGLVKEEIKECVKKGLQPMRNSAEY